MKKNLLFFVILMMGLTVACTDDDVNPDKVPPVVEVPEDDKVAVVSDNLYYNETQLNVEQSYWVVLEDREQEDHAHDAIKWYVNDELLGNTAQFNFTPTAAGEYNIKYVVDTSYSTTAVEMSKEVMVKTYSSSGVYILNEPNMSATEETRSINKHIFGSKTVDRFITGDYTSFGVTNQYIVNWAGKIYNLAPYPYDGITFSQFKATDGAFVKAIKSLPDGDPMTRAFAGVTPEIGVLTSADGAYIVDLTDLTLSSTIMTGSEGSKNIFVSDGYIFMITSNGAKAYKVDGLSTTTEPDSLGDAKTGFIKSKDGSVWAANGGKLLRINPRDLSTQQVILPEGAEIKFSNGPWKQCSWVASTADNTFFFTKGSYDICKYNIDNGMLTSQFIISSEDGDMNGYKHYSTSLLYDAQSDDLICMAIKPGWGANSAYNGLFLFNATTGKKTDAILYNTPDQGHEDYLNMFFPAMMAPMKAY